MKNNLDEELTYKGLNIKLEYKNNDIRYFLIHTIYDGDDNSENNDYVEIKSLHRTGEEVVKYPFETDRTHILIFTGDGRVGDKLKVSIKGVNVDETVTVDEDGGLYKRIIFNVM